MNISAISNNNLVGKMLRFPLRLIPNGILVPILQGKIKGKRWIVGSSNHGCWLGSYEYRKRLIFEKLIASGDVVFDIGAHVGFYTLLASVLVGSQGKVYAFEPLPHNISYLNKHIDINKISNVRVIKAAVYHLNGQTFFQEGRNNSTGHISTQGKLQVQTVKLDDLYKARIILAPDKIKIDVEGAEFLVLLGAKTLITTCHPTIFLATHGRYINNECCKFLLSIGYKIEAIDGKDLYKSKELLAYLPVSERA